ncbi:MAG TPA: NEW3 domain-containing protein [Candidatus Acidoferrum sp.]|nr:NEW3 domain-containing protein [Candidatus Acidoferrum sp.]
MDKKIILGILSLFATVVLLSGVAGAQSASVASDALSIQGLTINPTPVVAGDNITISFNLFNSYSQSLSEVSLWVTADNPIINVSPAYSTYLSTIGTGQYGGIVSNRFSYTLHVPSTLQAGEYEIDVVSNYQTTEGTDGPAIAAQSVMPIYIYVYGSPQVSLNVYPTGKITPGQDFTATISAINSGTDIARNVTVQLLNSTYFAPDGPNFFSYGTLQSGGSSSVTATIFTDQNIPGGQNYLKARVNYTTNQGANVSSIVNIPINILQNLATFSITNVTGKVMAGSTYTPVTFVLKNSGNEEATSISLSLQTIYPVTPTSPDAYIAELQPGQSTNVTFYVSGNSDGDTGEYPVTLYAQWSQPNGATNQQYSGSVDYFVQVQGQVGLISGMNTNYFIAIGAVVVVIIVAVGVRRVRKKGINSKKQK